MVAGHQVVQQLLYGGEHQVAHQFLQSVVNGAQETCQARKDLAPLCNLGVQGFASWKCKEAIKLMIQYLILVNIHAAQLKTAFKLSTHLLYKIHHLQQL